MARNIGGVNDIWCGDTLGPSELTLAIFASSTSLTLEQAALSYSETTAGDDADSLYFRGDFGGDPVQYRFANGGAAGAATHGSAYSSGVVYHLCGVRSSATSHSIFRDGAGKVTSATNVSATAVTRIVIGANQATPGGAAQFLNGNVAMAALWSAALTDDEVVSLAKGFAPRRVRPQSLFFYAPLVRNLLDWIGRRAFTDAGTTAADHPRCYGF